jgi:tetratricopeptide (TPR) repeat protein
MRFQPKTLFCAVALSAAIPAAMAQHGDHAAHGTPTADQIGSENVSFATSCSPSTADNFNRGVALVHSFWFAEAINTFNAVLAEDPECAVAHWGIALSHWGNPFAGQRNSAQLARGQTSVQAALGTGSPDERESTYINAVAELFSNTEPGTQGARTLAYEGAMAALVEQHPDDMEAQIFYALAVNQTASPNDKTYSQQLKAAEILEPLFMQYPDHPGLAHYIIHAYDHPPLAARALNAARRYASLAPDAPHALHMPSHTFTRVGMWQESVDSNLRSAQIARESSTAGEELHALDYQVYAYLQMAQDKKALEVVERARALVSEVDITAIGATQAGAFAIATIPARYALERGDFAAAAALEVVPAETTPHTQAITHFARAVGAARNGQPDAAAQDISMLAELRERARARQDTYWTEQINIQHLAASAWVVFAAGNQQEGIRMMSQAADIEDATDKASVSPGPMAPARELLGTMLLEAGQPADALAALEATLAKEPNRFLTLSAAAQAAEDSGDADKARQYYQQLLTVAASADSERTALEQAREFMR